MHPTPPNPPPPPTVTVARAPDEESLKSMRSAEFRPRRSIWPGLLVATLIGAGIAALLVSEYYDDRSLGARLDATVDAANSTVNQGVEGLREKANDAAQSTAATADRVADAVGDAKITAAVKTALAADPTLSAAKIDVTTKQGAVLLEGPAPDEKSRRRAEVLAQAPDGVARVDNRLVVRGTAAAPQVNATPAPAPAEPAASSR